MPTKYGIDTPEDRRAKQAQAEQEKEDKARRLQEDREKVAAVIDDVLADYVSVVGGVIKKSENLTWNAPGVYIYFSKQHADSSVVINTDNKYEYLEEVVQMAEAIYNETRSNGTWSSVTVYYDTYNFGNRYWHVIASF